MKRFWLPAILTTVMLCASLQEGLARQLRDRNTSKDTPPSGNAFLLRAIEANTAEVELGMMAQSRSQNPRVQKFAAMLVKDHTNALDRLHRLAIGGVSPLPNTDTNGGPADTGNSPPAECMDGKHAAQKSLSKEHQRVCNRLAKLSGAAFDREYVNAMVQEHRKALEEFEQQAYADSDSNSISSSATASSGLSSTDSVQQKAQQASDKDARSIARELLPTLRTHLKQAESLQRQFTPESNLK